MARRRLTLLGGLVTAMLAASAALLPPASAVIGARDALPGEAPFMVSLDHASDGFHFCGASVIAPNWVLTAAHCVVGESPGELRAVIGRRVRSDTASGQAHTVSALFVHPQYDPVNAINDVALVRLATPTSATRVRLASASDDYLERAGTPTTVFGWGATLVPIPMLSGIVDSPDALQAAEVPVVDDGACRAIYAATFTNVLPVLGSAVPSPPDHVCAAGLLRDACYGDSGGPLVATTPAGFVQLGIVSTGLLCAVPTHAGIYTEVNSPAVRNWIAATSGV